MVSHYDSTFAVWNTLTSLKEHASNNMERKPIVDESEQICYMVQGNDSLEVNLESHLDDCASYFDDHDSSMDAQALNEELFMFCENLLKKYKVLKNKSFESRKESENLFLKLNMILQERAEISNERDSLKSQLNFALNEKEFLKSKNTCDDILKKNEVLSSNF